MIKPSQQRSFLCPPYPSLWCCRGRRWSFSWRRTRGERGGRWWWSWWGKRMTYLLQTPGTLGSPVGSSQTWKRRKLEQKPTNQEFSDFSKRCVHLLLIGLNSFFSLTLLCKSSFIKLCNIFSPKMIKNGDTIQKLSLQFTTQLLHLSSVFCYIYDIIYINLTLNNNK